MFAVVFFLFDTLQNISIIEISIREKEFKLLLLDI